MKDKTKLIVGLVGTAGIVLVAYLLYRGAAGAAAAGVPEDTSYSGSGDDF